ncbi:hypothetical protein CYY_010166 [Polysphondylium violaceum]|uniref:Transmembrane protein n=1 Tax=Polysphondylium violaceum TaxID=133409 RepID=A0A8J4PKA8_9MYCE|nr:hypothetical protein CYY_010166 [Polysphondylium violaceum]
MKFVYGLIVLVALITVFNSVNGEVMHWDAPKGSITYCTMCNTSANCDPNSNHTCTDYKLGSCYKIADACHGTFIYGIFTQDNKTISTTVYNEENCTTVSSTTTNVDRTCFTCYNDLQVLCYEDTHGSTATKFLPGALLIVASLLASLF